MKFDYLLIDGRHLLWRSSDAFKNLAVEIYDEMVGTGGMYGFISILKRVHQRYGGKVIICWEGANNFRKVLYPEYKGNRKPLTEEMIDLFDDMREQEKRLKAILRCIGVEQYCGIECEADDVIGRLSLELSKNKKMVGIYSGDSDLIQLVTDCVNVIQPGFKGDKDRVFDVKKTKNRYSITPKQIADLKALSGDSSDNIPGLKGVGEKTATKLIVSFGDIENIINESALNDNNWPVSERFRKIIIDNSSNLKLYKNLTTIQKDKPMKLIKPKKSKKRVKNYFKLYGFTSLLVHSELHFVMELNNDK